MASPSPETNNPTEHLAHEQRDFEETVRFFSDPEQREVLSQFEALKKEDGMVFATPEGSFIHISNPSEDPEDEGSLNYIFSYEKMQDGTRSSSSREISLPKNVVPGEAILEDGGMRRVIFDLSIIKDAAPEDKPETVRWLVDTFGGHKLAIESDAPNAIARLENENRTIGFDSENVEQIAASYQIAVEYNEKKHLEVATEQVDKHFASWLSVMGLRNRWLRGSAANALRKRNFEKAHELKALMKAGRDNRIAKYKGWIDFDQPAIPKVQSYRRG